MQGSKITLSPSEAALICNADIILTKNSIIEKTIALLASVQETIYANYHLHGFTSSPKISKGENYNGLPYVVLDYPRISNGTDLYFIRSMFWWGHFFSSTLQVAGRYKQSAVPNLQNAYLDLASAGYFAGTGTDPWQHHFEPTNYTSLTQLSEKSFAETLEQQPHIKIAARWSLSEWDAAANNLTASWNRLSALVS